MFSLLAPSSPAVPFDSDSGCCSTPLPFGDLSPSPDSDRFSTAFCLRVRGLIVWSVCPRGMTPCSERLDSPLRRWVVGQSRFPVSQSSSVGYPGQRRRNALLDSIRSNSSDNGSISFLIDSNSTTGPASRLDSDDRDVSKHKSSHLNVYAPHAICRATDFEMSTNLREKTHFCNVSRLACASVRDVWSREREKWRSGEAPNVVAMDHNCPCLFL